MYNVYYIDYTGKERCSSYYATSKKDAEKQWNEEKDVGEVIKSIKKAK
jgi:hypothetical protein